MGVILVSSDTSGALFHKVAEKAADGFDIYGNMFVSMDGKLNVLMTPYNLELTYFLVEATDVDECARKISRLVDDGFFMVGGIVIHGRKYLQWMARMKEQNAEGGMLKAESGLQMVEDVRPVLQVVPLGNVAFEKRFEHFLEKLYGGES